MHITIIIENWFSLPSTSLWKLRPNLMNYHFNESLPILPQRSRCPSSHPQNTPFMVFIIPPPLSSSRAFLGLFFPLHSPSILSLSLFLQGRNHVQGSSGPRVFFLLLRCNLHLIKHPNHKGICNMFSGTYTDTQEAETRKTTKNTVTSRELEPLSSRHPWKVTTAAVTKHSFCLLTDLHKSVVTEHASFISDFLHSWQPATRAGLAAPASRCPLYLPISFTQKTPPTT